MTSYPPKTNPSSNDSPKGRNLPSPLKSQSLQSVSYPDLPSDPKRWSSSHVASYLIYCLRLYPPAIVSDLSKHVEQDVKLNGKKFLRLKEEQLRQMNFNEKWIKLMMVGVKSLRRDHLKDKILLNNTSNNDIITSGMKITEESSEEFEESFEDYSSFSSLRRNSLERNSSYSSTTTVSSNISSFSNNDLTDFLIPASFSNLTSDDKEFISQEFNKLKDFLKSNIKKDDNNNDDNDNDNDDNNNNNNNNNNNKTNFYEINRIIEKFISNIQNNKINEVVVGDKVVDKKFSKISSSSSSSSSIFWSNIKSGFGFVQGIMIGGVVVWMYMRYSK